MKRKRKKYTGVRRRGKESFQINYYVNGNRQAETVTASSEKEAFSIRNKRLVEASPQSQIVSVGCDLTYDSAFEHYLLRAENRLHENTIERSKCVYRRFVEYMKREYPKLLYINQVTRQMASNYIDYLLDPSDKIKPKTKSGVNSEIERLSGIFNKIKQRGVLEKNVFHKIEKIPKKEATPKKKHLPTAHEIRTILKCTKDDPSYREITRFLVRTGRRIEETALYEKKDVLLDGKGRPIRIKIQAHKTKTKQESDDLDLDDELADIIKEALLKKPEVKYLFTNKEGRKIAQNTYRMYLERICKANNLTKITPHCFRYYVCNKLLNECINTENAMAITGHTDLESFMSYIIVTDEGKQKALSATRLDMLDSDKE